MSAAPYTESGGSDRLVAAARNAIGRFDAAENFGNARDVFVEVGEALFWLRALADHLGAKDALIEGLRWPRDQIAHGQIVTAPTQWTNGTELGQWERGAGKLGTTSQHRWVTRPTPANRHERRLAKDWGPFYDTDVAGQPVGASFRAALELLDAMATGR